MLRGIRREEQRMADVLKELKEISHMGCIDDRGEIAKKIGRASCRERV